MPLTLPAGAVPAVTSSTRPLSGETGRVEAFQFYLLDSTDTQIGVLDGVQPGGSAQWSAASSVKGSGTINVLDLGQGIDWLNVRIKPTVTIAGIDGEQPLGIWLPAAPDEKWTDLGRSWQVSLTDKTSLLDQDIWTDGNSNPAVYTAGPGTNIIATVRAQIAAVGGTTGAITDDPSSLSSAMTWDVGTTRLKIVNDLLDAGGFFSLYCDMFGNFRADKYRKPSDRPVAFQALGPFTQSGVMSPDWKVTRDIYAVPNRFVAIGQGTDATAALVGTATNTDPASPYSYTSRGRWVTTVATGVAAVDQAAIDTYAQRHLQSATQITSTFAMQHLTLPGLQVNDVVQVINTAAGIDVLCTVANTTVPFDPAALASSTLGEVLS